MHPNELMIKREQTHVHHKNARKQAHARAGNACCQCASDKCVMIPLPELLAQGLVSVADYVIDDLGAVV
jgi:hypothetical protein